MVAGRPLREVAAIAGISVSTVQRRLKNPEVIAEIRQDRSRQRQETLGQFNQLRTASIERLWLFLNDSDSSIALRAISLILSTAGRLDSVYDLEQRLAALEDEFDDRHDADVADEDAADDDAADDDAEGHNDVR